MKILLSFILAFAYTVVSAQSTLPFRADTIDMYKQGGSAELKLRSSTRDTVGGLLTNIGGGITHFLKPFKLNDTTIVVGGVHLNVGSSALSIPITYIDLIGHGPIYPFLSNAAGDTIFEKTIFGTDGVSVTTGTDSTINIKADTAFIYAHMPGGSGVNIYNSDGTLTGARTLDGDGNDLGFTNINEFDINIADLEIQATGPNGTSNLHFQDTTSQMTSQAGGNLSNLLVTPNTIKIKPFGYQTAPIGSFLIKLDNQGSVGYSQGADTVLFSHIDSILLVNGGIKKTSSSVDNTITIELGDTLRHNTTIIGNDVDFNLYNLRALTLGSTGIGGNTSTLYMDSTIISLGFANNGIIIESQTNNVAVSGNIQLQSSGYSGHSAGEVWTLTDPTTGLGDWSAVVDTNSIAPLIDTIIQAENGLYSRVDGVRKYLGLGGNLINSPTIDGLSSFFPTFTSALSSQTVKINNTGGGNALRILTDASATNTPVIVQSITATTNGTATAGFGASLSFLAELTDGSTSSVGLWQSFWKVAAPTSGRISEFNIQGTDTGNAEIFFDIQHDLLRFNNNHDTVASKAYARSLASGTTGTVTSLSSPNSSISIATATTTPTLDINLAHANFFSTNQSVTALGIGTGSTTPAALLQVVETSTSTPRGILADQYGNNTSGSRITMRKARGTFGTPATIVTGDVLASWTAAAYDGTNFLDAGKILVTSTGTIGTGITPTIMDLQTMNASGTLTTAIDISASQVLTFNHYTANGGIFYGNGSGVVSQTAAPGHAGMRPVWNGTNVIYTDTTAAGSTLSGTGLVSASGASISYNTTSSSIAAILSDETGSGAMVFGTAPTFASNITIGTVSSTTGSILFKGTTSGTTTFSVPDVAGTYTYKLPPDAGTDGFAQVSDGSGNTRFAVPDNDWDAIRKGLGSAVLWETPWKMYNMSAQFTMVDNAALYVPVYIRKTTTITGVKWYQHQAGAYTNDNTNQVGLFTYSAGTITLVASSTDDGTIWKTTGQTFGTKAFSSTYSAAPGLYFIGILYNNSAQTTAPIIGAIANLASVGGSNGDFTNSARFTNSKGSTNALPSTLALSTATTAQTMPWLALY